MPPTLFRRLSTTSQLLSKASKSRPKISLPASKPPPAQEGTISHPSISPNPKPWTRPEPPFVERARQKSVKERNVWESYLVLDPKIRLWFSLSVMAFAAGGLYAGDWLVPESESEEEDK